MSEVFYRLHAQEVMAERKVLPDEVEAVIRRPEVTYAGDGKQHPREYRICQGGDLAVVTLRLRNGDIEVVTVLWRTEQQWTNPEMKENRKK